MLLELLKEEETAMIAFQIGFDLHENENQAFLNAVHTAVDKGKDEPDHNFQKNMCTKSHFSYILAKLKDILAGKIAYELNLWFMQTHIKTDPAIMTQLKEGIPEVTQFAF
jgi:hypothetical protein